VLTTTLPQRYPDEEQNRLLSRRQRPKIVEFARFDRQLCCAVGAPQVRRQGRLALLTGRGLDPEDGVFDGIAKLCREGHTDAATEIVDAPLGVGGADGAKRRRRMLISSLLTP
jgi:hypothetical protein